VIVFYIDLPNFDRQIFAVFFSSLIFIQLATPLFPDGRFCGAQRHQRRLGGQLACELERRIVGEPARPRQIECVVHELGAGDGGEGGVGDADPIPHVLVVIHPEVTLLL
jgi:hypothetical protein